MWLRNELSKIQTLSLSTRQQIDLLQDNAYTRCNIDFIIASKVSLSNLKVTNSTSEAIFNRHIEESKAAWDNIVIYIQNFFPNIWTKLYQSELIPEYWISPTHDFDPSSLDLRIRSYKNFLEVLKSITYGGSLRYPFSQNPRIQTLHQNLIQSCRLTDIPGKFFISGQKRVSFYKIGLTN